MQVCFEEFKCGLACGYTCTHTLDVVGFHSDTCNSIINGYIPISCTRKTGFLVDKTNKMQIQLEDECNKETLTGHKCAKGSWQCD